LLSLAQIGITEIELTGTATGETAAQRVAGQSVVFNTARFRFADGSTGSLSDVGLAYDPAPLGSAAEAGKTILAMDSLSFSRKAKHFRLTAMGGAVYIGPKKPAGALDPGAGRVGGATILDFKNRSIGLLAPIILDLDGDGIEMKKASKSKARFDMDGDGIRDDTGWIGKGDGFLVIDRNGDGAITTAAELSFLSEKADAKSDLEGLAVLDANKDGRIDKNDARFAELKVWADSDRDGITDSGELSTLGEAGITQIDLKSTTRESTAKPGDNLLLATASFTRSDGSVHTLGDAALAFDPSSAWSRSISGANVRGSEMADLLAQESSGDPDRARILQMVQAMNGFGAVSAAETGRLSSANDRGHYDYFASAMH